MKIKQVAFFLAVSILFTLTASSEEPRREEYGRGNYTYLNPFSYKPATPKEHWNYATSLLQKGKSVAARKQFEIFVKRWPDSEQAGSALLTVAALRVQEGDDAEAFEAYEQLIQTYYTGLKDYDSILERQYAIAQRQMESKRMRWLFGGYKAPERAIPYLESILRNAPQWKRAPEMQYQIGKAHQENGDLVMAVGAYSAVEYRYPDSPLAEQAALAKIDCLKKISKDTPYSVEVREDAQLAADLFAETYPNSQRRAEVDQFAADLTGQVAAHDLEVAQFYERVPKRPEAARVYYKAVTNAHPQTSYAETAAERLRVMIPGAGSVGSSGRWIVDGAGNIDRDPLPEITSEDPDALEVVADQLRYEDNLLIGEGNVAVQQQGASLQADYVSVDRETGEIIARGDVLMLRGDDRWEGQELMYNYQTRAGAFGPSSMFFDPVYISADKTEQVSSNEYLLVNVQVTTCSGDDPIVYAKAKEARLIDNGDEGGRLIKAKHVTFYANGVPVFYSPYWQRNLKDRVFTFTYGYGGRLGAFILGTATVKPTEWLESQTHLDYYTARGVGLGQDFNWTSPNGHGNLKSYYINDQDPYEDEDLTAAEQSLIDSDRYRLHVDHYEQLTNSTYFSTEVNYLSDPFIMDDFFDEEYRSSVNPENYAVLQHSTNDYAAGIRVDHRLNDFYTTVDRLPEGSFNLYRRAIGEYLYFQSDNSAGYYSKLYSSTNDFSEVSDYSSGRVDSYNQLFAPLRFSEFLNVIPRVAYRGTWYSDTQDGGAEYRNIFEAGALTSYKAHKVLTEKGGFFGTGLRHVVEPYAEYLYRHSDVQTNALYQFDDIDELNSRNQVRFGVRNFIQTKRGAKRTENFLDADVYTTYRFDYESDEDPFALLGADVELSLTDNFTIQTDLEYNMHESEFERFNARANYQATDDSRYWCEYRYLVDTRSLVTLGADLFPNDDWFYQFLVRYDAENGDWRRRQFMVNRNFDCLGMGLGLKLDEDNVPSLWFNLWLKAFGPKHDFDRL
jgi:lipopolysaccharide assembly outer membrane protein LptD (OstA)/outer membrane protein assembly factor BamD (BamD/ComL family)